MSFKKTSLSFNLGYIEVNLSNDELIIKLLPPTKPSRSAILKISDKDFKDEF